MVQCSQSSVRQHRSVCSAHAQPCKRQLWGLLYHDAAKRPQQNRTCCGFAWFNVLKPVRESASAHEVRAAAQAAGLRLLYHDAAKRPQQNRTCCGFAWSNVLKALCVSTGACALHTRSRVNGSFGGYYTIKIRVCTGGNMQCPPPWRSVRGASGQDGKKEKICVKYYQLYRKMAV